MRFTAICLLASTMVAAATASDVIDATDATFDSVISSSDFVLMEFYAPWCGHCKKLEPEFDTAAAELKGVAVLAKIDTTVEKEAGEKFEIKGFPTIKIFREGQVAGDYEGGRTAADIVKYIKGNVGPALKVAATAEELAAFKAEGTVTVVAQLAEASGLIFDAVDAAAKSVRSTATFVLVTDSALFAGEENTVVLSKTFDDKADVKFTGDLTNAGELENFVKTEAIPVFDEIGPENYQFYIQRGLPMAWLFVTASDAEAKAAAAASAPEFKGKLSFVWVDADKYGGMAARLGLPENQFPSFAIDDEGKHFPLQETISTEALNSFTAKFVAGGLKSFEKSEGAPEEHTIKGLTTVVGSTFKTLVVESEQDVFIKFYAPWCGHCKTMAPAYEEVAEEVAGKVVVAKFDATANDHDQKLFPVKGFPTLFWYPKATREPTVFEGERTKEGILAFINEKTA